MFWATIFIYISTVGFQRIFIPEIVDFYDETGQITDIKRRDCDRLYQKFQTYIPFEKYLTEEYYYGDYTKMNTYLVNRYQIPLDLNAQIINPGLMKFSMEMYSKSWIHCMDISVLPKMR